jgi:hypothetical protein
MLIRRHCLLWPSLLMACLGVAPLHGQSAESNSSPPPPVRSTESAKDSTRVAGIVPAFNSSDDVNAPALTHGDKFHLFSRTVTDPFNLIMPAVNAVILNSADVSSGYEDGFSGTAKRYASSLADSTTGNFFRLYAYPALLREDPRYFRAGNGSIGKRTIHVFGAVFITRRNDPSFRFNWSKLLATASSAGLSNAYYPAENRGARLTLSRIGLSYLTEIGSNAMKEFWPDIAKKMRKSKGNENPATHSFTHH